MNTSLVYTLLTITLLSVLIPIEQEQLSPAQSPQSDCVKQAVQNAEVLARKELDVNQDETQDDVVIYGNGDLYALVVVNNPQLGCKIILNDRLTSRQLRSGDRKIVTIQQVELVDLTGDNQPELHVWLDLNSGDYRTSYAFHKIYWRQDEIMKPVFVIEQCLDLSSFEFRIAPDGARLIYRDIDSHCEPPSSRRNYEVYRWNTKASQFERIESGEIAKWTPDPFWDALLVVFVLPVTATSVGVVVVGLIIWRRSKKKRTQANTS